MKKIKWILIIITIALVSYVLLYWLQEVWAHRNIGNAMEYQQIELSENFEYETFFLQTGLGKTAINKLIEKNEFDTILNIQEKFWEKPDVVCKSIFGLYSKVDKVDRNKTPEIVDLQPGDILITLSTHSAGWHHGHAGLVLDENYVLECVKWGEESEIVKVSHWRTYSNYVVMRVKNASSEEAEMVAKYAKENLCGVPYRLSVGVLSGKLLDRKNKMFGTHCGHCVWYAWKMFGYDLDSDGGRIVTPYDVMMSKEVEIVQVYGMNPKIFM